MAVPSLALCVVLSLALLLPAFSAWAQAPQSRERELLRRAQAALRDVTAERDNLRATEAASQARLSALETALERARAEATALRPPLERARAEAAETQSLLQAERAKFQQAEAEQQAAAARREATLRAEAAALRQALAERTLANRSLSVLLERGTAALLDAERRNAELHALSLRLIDRWRHKTPAEALLHGETLIGVAGVRAEDQAEQWRAQADALSRPSAAR